MQALFVTLNLVWLAVGTFFCKMCVCVWVSGWACVCMHFCVLETASACMVCVFMHVCMRVHVCVRTHTGFCSVFVENICVLSFHALASHKYVLTDTPLLHHHQFLESCYLFAGSSNSRLMSPPRILLACYIYI